MNRKENPIFLSICIPTYNRSRVLIELVKDILSNKRTDIEVVVTDNSSDDNTVELLNDIKDKRLTVYQNRKTLPAYCNMVEAIFNAKGKYAFYCNDRDLIHMDKVENLINVLCEQEYSFLYIPEKKRNNKLKVYDKGYDSIMNQSYTHHPTGMVFNVEIINKFLKKEDYFKYLEDFYTLSFLARDLIQFEKSAIFHGGCWNQRNKVFLRENKSGTVFNGTLYFYPEFILKLAKDTLKQVSNYFDCWSSAKQKQNVTINLLKYFSDLLILYKINMMNINETSHYGIRPKFVSTIKMIKINHRFNDECLNYLCENYFSKEIIQGWKNISFLLLLKKFFVSLMADAGIILLVVKNIFIGMNYDKKISG